MSYTPQVNFSDLTLYIGSCATGRATASSTTLDTVVFAQLHGQPSATTFTPDDVGMPIAIVGGGPVNALMPAPYYVQGATFVTTIAAYVSPSQVTLTAAPNTSFFNTGFYNIIVYRPCPMASDVSAAGTQFQFSSSIAPGTRDTLQASVLNADNAYITRFTTICLGQPVYLTSASNVLGINFGGYIDTLTVKTMPGVATIFSWEFTCASWAGLATRRVVPPQNAQVMTSDGGTVFTQVVLFFLQNDGVSVTVPLYLPTITLPCAAGAAVNQLLDQVVSLLSTPTTTYYWYADEWRNFVLATRTAVAAPWDVTDGSDLFAGDTPYQQSIQTTHNQMANFVYGIGSKVLLNALGVTFHGDGSTQTFNVPNPVGSTPAITLNSVTQTVGVLGVDVGFEWYWSEGSTTITQDPGGTPISATDVLIVAYDLETPAVAQAPNSASLIDLQAIEGTSAEYDYAFNVAVPIDPQHLLDLASGYVNEYGEPAQTVQFYTLRPGLATGQLQNITLAQAGISGSFLIATIQVTTDHNVLVWQYTAFGGANIGDAITGLVQFINRGSQQLAITTPVVPIKVGLHEITIDHTKVSGADKTNFTFLFAGTYSWLTGPPNGNVAYASGVDIYFSSDSEGNDVMDFDLEFYNPATGQIAAWVRIPTLSHTVDTVIYIQYGNPLNSTTQVNPHGVWSPVPEVSGIANANYREVFHLIETTGPYFDSTKYGNNSTGSLGAGYPTRVSGPFAYAQQYTITYEGIAVPNALVGNGLSNFSGTLDTWLKMAAGTGGSSGYQDAFDAQVTSTFGWGMAIVVVNHFACGVLNYNGAQLKFSSSVVVDDGNWHQIVMTMSASNAYLYVDGALAATAGIGQNEAMLGSSAIQLSGNRGGLGFATWYGELAECKVNQAAIDADTIATLWANQSSPSTFYSVGDSQQGPPSQTTNVLGNPGGTVTHSTGALTANLPVLGNGGGDIKVGVAGQLVPAGGTTGQVLEKNSNADYDTVWGTGGGGSSPLTTKGDVYGYSTADARIPVGADGQVLTADSTQALGVKWGAPGGGNLLFLGSATASSSAELDLTSLITSLYDTYLVVVEQLIPSASGQRMLLQFSANNGSSYDTTSGHYCWAYQFGNIPGAGNNTESNASDIGIVMAIGQLDSTTAWGGLSGSFTIHNPLGGASYTQIDGVMTGKDNRDAQGSNRPLSGYYAQTTAVNAFRLKMDGSANITSGIVRVYAITSSAPAVLPGALVLLEQHTASNSAELDFTASFSSIYDQYVIEFQNILPATNGQPLRAQMGTGAGPTYDTGSNYMWGYNYVLMFVPSGGSYSSAGTDTAMQCGIAQVDSSSTWNGLSGQATVHNPNSGGYVYLSQGPYSAKDSRDAGPNSQTGGSAWKGSAIATAIRFFFASGNIASGTIRIYGVSH